MGLGRSVRKLMAEAEGMPYGFARTAVAEEAVRTADAANDLDGSFAAREVLASSAMHGGEPQKALVAVTWCLAQLDAHPGRFDRYATYWALKWLPTTLVSLPDVPLEEIDRVIAEAERRYLEAGEGADAVAKLRWVIPRHVGRTAEALEGHRTWRMLPRSEYSDCRACDVSGEMALALDAGEPGRALDLARPLLGGRLECAEQPAIALGQLLGPLLDLGRHEEAERLHLWGLRLSRGNPSLVSTQAEHVRHLLRTGRMGEAFELTAELVDVCDRGLFDVEDRTHVDATTAAVLTGWHEAGLGALPRPLGDRTGDAVELAAAIAARAREVAAAFDRRNGTEHVGREIERMLATRPHAPVAVPVPAAPAVPASAPASASAPVAEAAAGPAPDGTALLARAREPRGTSEQRHAFAVRALAAFEAEGDAGGVARARRTVAEALLRLERLDEAAEAFERAIDELGGDPQERGRAAVSGARLEAGRSGPEGARAQRYLAVARAAAEAEPAGELARGRVRLLEAEWLLLARAELEDDLPEGVAAVEFTAARELLAGDAEELLEAWEAEAWARSAAGDLAGARTAAETAWEMACASGRAVDVVSTATVVVPLLLAEGELDRAIEVLAAAQRGEESLDDPGEAGRAALTRADLLADAGRADEGLAAAFAAADLFLTAGRRDDAAWARLTAARLFRELDRDENAADLLVELLEQASEDGERELEGAVALQLAQLDGEFGMLDEALPLAERAVRAFGPEHGSGRAKAYRVLAQVHEAMGKIPEAVAAGVSCLAHVDEEDEPLLAAELRREHAERLVRAGAPDRSLELFDAAEAGFRSAGDPVAAAAVDLGRVEALAALGRREEVLAAAGRALEVGRQEDVPWIRAEALWALAAHQEPDEERYAVALRAYEEAGAPPEQLEDLASQRDGALGAGRSRWRRR